MSIGALAKATGVPADTLRTWERRYGFPEAERTDSGHRRYSLRTLDRLRRVLRLIEQGHRPSSALGADEATLLQWLSAEGPAASLGTRSPRDASAADVAGTLERWLGHVERYEGRALVRELRVSSSEAGAVEFLDGLLARFLVRVGERWQEGSLGVAHEHFASERVQEFLAQTWRPLTDAATGSVWICAAPPGELHVLGLHMAALVLALHNCRVVFLGANVPVTELVQAVEHHAADAVALSCSAAVRAEGLHRDLKALRAALPRDTTIVMGGAGAVASPAGIAVLDSYAAFAELLNAGTR